MFCPKETDSSMSKLYEKISVMAVTRDGRSTLQQYLVKIIDSLMSPIGFDLHILKYQC